MASAGDYKFYQRVFQKATGNLAVAAGDSATVAVIAAAPASYTLYVQKISVAVITHSAGKSLTFQDSAGTPIKFAVFNDQAAAAGVPDTVVFDFGPEGVPVTEAKALNVAISSAGIAAQIHAEGYIKQSTTLKAQAATNVGQF